MNKSNNKLIGFFSIIFGLFGLLILTHHIASYDAILVPYMDYLIENKVITNDISGIAFLRMFTNQSNIFINVFFILFGLGHFGSKKLYDFTHNDKLRGGITLYIFVTGIIYCAVLLPFQKATFPWEKGIWFSNIFNYWAHMVVPAVSTIFWFKPLEKETIAPAKTAKYYLIYPIIYFIVSVILGKVDGFYPYPFLNSNQLWETLFANKPYNPTVGILLIAAVIVVFCGLFFGIGCGLIAIHNTMVKKANKADSKK